MKKIFALIGFVAMAFPGFSQQSGFTVSGTITGLPAEEAYIYVNNDVIATSAITDGTFKLEGSVTGLQAAQIGLKGMNGGVPLLLENEEYTVSIVRGGAKIEGGGAAQQVFSQILNAKNKNAAKQGELSGAYRQAQQANDEEKMATIRAEFGQLAAEGQAAELEVIKANLDSEGTAFYVLSNAQQMDYETLKGRFELLSDRVKATEWGKPLSARLEAMSKSAVGQIAPDFTLPTPDGGELTLHQVSGKLKLIDFWASWCGPCRQENPNVVALYNEYHSKGLEIIGVSLDNDGGKWLEAIEKDGLIWKHCSDLKGWQAAPAKPYMVEAIPHTVLLDENNRIIAKNLRGEALRAKVAELLD